VAITVKDSMDTAEEEEEDDDHNVDQRAPDAPPPSSTTTAATIPSDTMNMATYGLIVDERTVHSTVVDEEREVLVADSSSSHDDGKVTAAAATLFTVGTILVVASGGATTMIGINQSADAAVAVGETAPALIDTSTGERSPKAPSIVSGDNIYIAGRIRE
jgi:hypothetical protein